MPTSNIKTIGQLFVWYREKSDLSQRDLGLLLEVSPAYIAQIELDKFYRPIAICRALYKRMKHDEDRKILEHVWCAVALEELKGPPRAGVTEGDELAKPSLNKKVAKKAVKRAVAALVIGLGAFSGLASGSPLA